MGRRGPKHLITCKGTSAHASHYHPASGNRFAGFALLVVGLRLHTGDAVAQALKGAQKWEYATLRDEENRGTEIKTSAAWRTSKVNVLGQGKPAESLFKINKELGGEEGVGIHNVCVLLTRVGQDGWELVSHTHTLVTQIFCFLAIKCKTPSEKPGVSTRPPRINPFSLQPR